MKYAVLLLSFAMFIGCNRSPHAAADTPEFDYTRITGPLSSLSQTDRKTVEDTVALMKRGDHRLALVRLSALNDRNPSNSSLRLLTSYALLQLGNLAESLAEAQRSHDAADHGMYQCYMLAHVAAINGNKEIARREINHVRAGTEAPMKADVEALAKRTGLN